ncbi:hypothetical protein NQ315_005477 [Exocentrus adspersus]|uniref:Succinate--hydroxymethylglutarate CoA-transferase n=1 Tax=Exocentrus adspersus TaxID=1586481 RepID=A0AAV8VTH6_9CUCU|nr:hypothetical protein NQ315_005477 [Exocentrus adspersus]
MANTYEQNNFTNMGEAVTFQEQQDGTTSTVTVVETDEQFTSVEMFVNMFCSSKRIFACTNVQRIVFKSTQAACEAEKAPLHGIRVLDLTRIVAGPYCTMILGDLGAEILKIERPGTGDEARKWGPPFINDTTETCYFVSLNRNKKSVCLDMKSAEGRGILYELARKSDILVENYVPGKLDELKLGYDDLKKISPSLIYCSITGYGFEGPYRNRPGYDVIAASIGGLLHITGPKDGEPCKAGVAVTDLATGLYAHGAIMAALIKRSKTGRGQKIDCNLLSTQVAGLINIGSNYLNAGKEAKRQGTAHTSIVPYQAFPTKNGYFTIGAGSDPQFADFCNRIGRGDLPKNNKFLNNKLRVENREELVAILSSIFKTKTNNEWKEVFEGGSFPSGPVNSLKEVFEDPHIKAIDLVKTVTHPVAGKVKVVGPPVCYSEGGNLVRLPPPTLGQHTDEVLRDVLGFDIEKISALKAKEEVPRVTLKLRKPRTDRKVQWTTGTVDNENLNKKKSKCCCIYEKPRKFGESSSEESEDECDHCHGHVEKKKKKNRRSSASSDCSDGGGSSTAQPDSSHTVTVDN